MPIQSTYSNARENLAFLLEQVTENNEIVIISRRGYDDVALVALSELAGLLETAHLLRSPKNAQRLLKALHRAQGRSLKPQPLEKLRKNLGLDEEDQNQKGT
jgi:antitoxin YefM